MAGMASILLLSKYGPSGASSRLRCLQFIPALERRGFTVDVRPFFDESYLARLYAGRRADPRTVVTSYVRRLRDMRAARSYDLVWIEKECLPWLPAVAEQPAFRNVPTVVDFDDAWYLRYALNRHGVVRRLLGDKLARLVRGATCVVAGNAVLEDWARDQGAPRVARIPTVVDTDRYEVRPPPDGPFTVGWIGTPITAPYLRSVHEALKTLATRAPLQVRVVGAPGFTLDGVDVVSVPWSEATEVEALGGMHVGIMPLPDGPWERGKCGYKLIQYMAAGRTVVASPVGANTEIVRHGTTGFLASSTEDWVTALDHLRRTPEDRRRMAVEARRMVEETYSLKAQADRLAAVFRQAIDGAQARPEDVERSVSL